MASLSMDYRELHWIIFLCGVVRIDIHPAGIKNLKENIQCTHVKMIILQFGGNTATNLTDDYSYYEKSFLCPVKKNPGNFTDVAIVVIGVAACRLKIRRVLTYPNLEKVRDAMRNATLNANGIYWDTFEAMGQNSMPSWVKCQTTACIQ